MAITSPEVKAALETIFAADSEFYHVGIYRSRRVVPTFGGPITENQYVIISQCAELAKSG